MPKGSQASDADLRAGALAGRKVVEIGDEKGAYCGKLLADLGADVVRVEPPAGLPERAVGRVTGQPSGLFFLYANTNKRSIALDLARESERALLRELVGSADVVLDSYGPGYLDSQGAGYDAFRNTEPHLVWTSISGFGRAGPWRDMVCEDLVVSALSGAMHVIGHEQDPPVALAGMQTYIMASANAAAATLIALRHADRCGFGQLIDVSAHETMASVSHICGAGKYLDDGIVPKRFGTGLFASVPSGAYRCHDGLIYLMVNRPLHWKALAVWVNEVTGNREILDPMFEGPSSNRQPYRELLDIFITELTQSLTVAEAYHEGQRRHLAMTPVHTTADVLVDPHLRSRAYFVQPREAGAGTLEYPGPPYALGRTPAGLRRAAPSVDEHHDEVLAELKARPRPGRRRTRTSPSSHDATRSAPAPDRAQGEGVLAGLRVVEFTAGMAGPWVGRFMAWCGAEVIKIESLDFPDVTRLYVPPRRPELGVQSQMSPWFTDWNAGKRFAALDLREARATDLCKRLVSSVDVVIENYSFGVLDKLGLGHTVLRAVKPDLVMLSSNGYGDAGPYRRYVTWGPNIEALSGLSTLSGFPDRECTITQFAYPDPVSALHGLVAVMAALHHRDRSGEGQHIDMSQYEATASAIGHLLLETLATGRVPDRNGNRDRHAGPCGCYRCDGDDRWCAIVVRDERSWRRFCAAIGRPELADDERFATLEARLQHHVALDTAVESWTCTRDAYEVMHTLQSAGVAAGVVQTIADQLARDPQLAARGFFERIPHAKLGDVRASGIPLGFTMTPGRTPGTGAAVGQDNRYVWREIVGLDEAEYSELVSADVIQQG